MMRLRLTALLCVGALADAVAAVQFAWTDVNFPVEGRRYVYTGTYANALFGGSSAVDATREYAKVQGTATGVRFDVATVIRMRDSAAVWDFVETRELTPAGEVLLRRTERSGSLLVAGFEDIVFASVPVAPRTFEIGQRYVYSNAFTGSTFGREDRVVVASLVENVATGAGVMQTAKIGASMRNATGSLIPYSYGETGWYARNVGPVRLQFATSLQGLIDVTLVSANFPLAPLAFDGTGPQLNAHPESLALAAGATARFRVSASGDGLVYAWTKDGATLPGATEATLVLPAVGPGQAGLYRAVVTAAGVAVTSKPARLSVATEVPGQSGSLANLSVRAFAGDGGAQLIAGLSLQGTATPHRLLIRGVGPGLSGWLGGAAKDPALSVRSASGALVAENDDWGLAADPAALRTMMMNVGAFGLDPSGRDAAAAVPLGNGNYTALVRDKLGGIGLVECYDADAGLAGGFANLSARADVRTEALITGVVVGGGGTIRLLVRAVGPTLARLGVGDVHPNPTLRLMGPDNVEFAANDDWSTGVQREELRAAFAAVGAFPLDENSPDAALVATVPAGVYSAVVDQSALGGTVLVELYRLPGR